MLLRFLFFDLLDCFEMDDNREAEFDSCDRRISRKRERERNSSLGKSDEREREKKSERTSALESEKPTRLRVAKDKKKNP